MIEEHSSIRGSVGLKTKLEETLRDNLPAAPSHMEKQFNEALGEAVFSEDTFASGLIALYSAEIFGKKAENILPAAAAVEFIRAASQLFDNSLTSAAEKNEKYFAMLSLLNASYGLMFANTDVPAERAVQAHNELVECIGSGELFGSCEAQNSSLYADPAEAPASKTAIMMRLAVRIGATLAGADHLRLEVLSRFGGYFGEACQLKKDLSELNTDTEKLTSEMERDRLVHELNILVDDAKRILTTHFAENEAAGVLLELTEGLAGDKNFA